MSTANLIAEAAAAVRALKANKNTPAAQLKAAIEHLTTLKTSALETTTNTNAARDAARLQRGYLEDLLTRRFFYIPSFEIYGGVGGLYDFGPPGCTIKQALLSQWRSHFILHDSMLEVDCVSMTPHNVLKTSGHVDKFTDFMVEDTVTHEYYRADKLIEEYCEKVLEDRKKIPSPELSEELKSVFTRAGAMNREELDETIKKYNMTAPETGNALTPAYAFNLMFQTSIGPTGKLIGYLRPETAQGIFVNFRRLLEFNNGRMPFSVAQIGSAYRNEIAPRAGLLRVREFTLAEIEHFVHPNEKQHPRFKEIEHIELQFLGRADQTGDDICKKLTVGEAIRTGLVNNETLAYFMARTHMFLCSVGIKADRVRFREHKSTEMAHYAISCWDAEILGSYGWTECVGHADRSAYDLRVHTESSKVELMAQETFSEAKTIDVAVVKPNMAILGKKYGKSQKRLLEVLKSLSVEEATQFQSDLANKQEASVIVDNLEYKLTPDEVSVRMEQKKITSQKYIPHVIEPSFGIGRILYHILEHSFYIRPSTNSKDTSEKTGTGSGEVVRGVLGVPAFMAAVKVAILPISNQEKFAPLEEELNRAATMAGLTSRIDSSSVSIGRRYARVDEIGTPYAVTIDFQSVEDRTVTIRERDSCQQIRLKITDAIPVLSRLINDSAHVVMHEQLNTTSSEAYKSYYRWEHAYTTYEQVSGIKEE